MQTVIIKNLNKSFGNIQAIKDLSLNIEKGKITVLLVQMVQEKQH